MELNEKKINRTRSTVNWAVAVVLAVFLILLSYSVLYDLGSSVREPQYDAFTDRARVRELDGRKDSLSGELDAAANRVSVIEADIRQAEEDYSREKAYSLQLTAVMVQMVHTGQQKKEHIQ